MGRAQARISSTIQLLPGGGRTSTIPRGPARTLSTIHLLLEVGRTSTTPREMGRTSSITHHHQRAMMTRKTTNQNSPADTILQLLVLKSATALFLYQVQPMLLDTTTMESTPRPRESAGKSRFSMWQAHISHPLARLLTSTKQLVAHQAHPVLLSPMVRILVLASSWLRSRLTQLASSPMHTPTCSHWELLEVNLLR